MYQANKNGKDIDSLNGAPQDARFEKSTAI
jgi:hypothetical protein